jgi:exopolysaccharide biosynthesis predicted pyruvyltransferase EpsI
MIVPADYHDFGSFVSHVTLEGKKIYFDPCHGNNGDELIILGAEAVFARTGAVLTADPAAAGVIIINGGGMFVEGFEQGFSKVRDYSETYPRTPLCIGPQSFHLKSNAFAAIIARRTAPTIICLREQPSEDNLLPWIRDLDQVVLLRDHDLAFQIDEDHGIFRRPLGDKHILIVERRDSEHYTKTVPVEGEPVSIRDRIRGLFPESIQRPVRFLKALLFARKMTPFRQWTEDTIARDHPELRGLPRFVRDLSSREVATFDKFVQTICDAALVFTDRLHVGILAARLGKKTYLFEGNYHKCTGIYERSMGNYPNAVLVPRAAVLSASMPSGAGTVASQPAPVNNEG